MREIVPDVLTWSRPSERHGYDFNGHLLRHPEGNLCIDPVEPGEAVLNQLAVIGATRVLLTNRNHTRAANLFRARLGARTAIHPKDTDYARGQGAEIDDALEVGELLIVGDAIIGNPPGRCGLLPEKVMDDPLQMKQSIEDLLVFDFDTLLMGDGVSILSGAKDRLKELVASFRS